MTAVDSVTEQGDAFSTQNMNNLESSICIAVCEINSDITGLENQKIPCIAVPSQRAKTILHYVNTIIPLAKSRDIIKPRPII